MLLLLVSGPSARAELRNVFGLQEFDVTPSSGIATPRDPILIAMRGVAGSSQAPEYWNLTPSGANELTINLVNTSPLGQTVLTPWTFQVELPPLAAGNYDFYLQGFIPGFTTEPKPLLSEFNVGGVYPFPELPGDFNRDGAADDGDYNYWREQFADGEMTARDYVVWRNHRDVGQSGESTARSPVPEPASILLLVLGCAATTVRRRR